MPGARLPHIPRNSAFRIRHQSALMPARAPLASGGEHPCGQPGRVIISLPTPQHTYTLLLPLLGRDWRRDGSSSLFLCPYWIANIVTRPRSDALFVIESAPRSLPIVATSSQPCFYGRPDSDPALLPLLDPPQRPPNCHLPLIPHVPSICPRP